MSEGLTINQRRDYFLNRKKIRDLPATSNAGSGGKVSEVVFPDDLQTENRKDT